MFSELKTFNNYFQKLSFLFFVGPIFFCVCVCACGADLCAAGLLNRGFNGECLKEEPQTSRQFPLEVMFPPN